MKSLTPNTLLQNRYLVVQLIGKGGMGEVYLAVDQRLGSAVALKRTFFTDDEMLGSAFEREARTLARLRHPVLPKVSDHFLEDENQYLVMDHISGDDLSKRLESAKKPFPLNWVLFWADQLLDALHYLHSHNPPIVHRDIKPQNLKLTDDNHIVLLDFGLAKDNVGQTRVTSSGSVVGFTPHYAPMEQIRGIGTNLKSDIYSLSATLYQLLTNTVPADALTRADALLGNMPDPLIPITEINPEVSRTISDTIVKGMALSLDQRLSDAREMQKLLRDGYAQMQNAMSAQTIAFNINANDTTSQEIEQPEIAPPVAERLDQFATIVNENPVAASNPPIQNSNAGFSEKTEQMNFADITGQNADSAPLENNFANDSQPKQSDVKTEVFLAGSGALPSVELRKTEVFKTGNLPDETAVSFDSYGNGGDSIPPAAPTAFDSVVIPVENADNGFSFSPSQDFSDVEEVYSDGGSESAGAGFTQQNYNLAENNYAETGGENVSHNPPPQKKAGGKGLFIAGGLFLILFLIAGAAGAGWYIYTNSNEVAEDPLPTPQATPSAVPTPEPTQEVANTDEPTNTEVVSTDETNTDEVENQTKTVPVTTSKPPPNVPKQPTTATTTNKPPIVKNKPPKPEPEKPQPPKKKPEGGRTDILQ